MMADRIWKIIRWGVSTPAIAFAGSAMAQDNNAGALEVPSQAETALQAEVASDDDQVTTGEIVVTAQKQSESLQEVPLAITAITSDALQRSAITDLQGVTANIPNLNLGQQLGVAKIALRGIGLESLQPGAEGSIAFHVDEVFISRSVAALASFYDIEQVEVLRGPQGTLYGRNATGGSINLITRGPRDYLNGYANLTVGNYGRVVTEGAIGGPIVEDVLSARIAFQTQDRNGYGENTITGSDIDDLKSRSVRGSLRFTPTDRLTLNLKGDYYWQQDRSGGYHYLGAAGFSAPGVPIEPIGLALGGLVASDRRDITNNFDPSNKMEFWGLTGKLNYELTDSLDFVSITAYRELDYTTSSDIDSTSAPLSRINQAEQDWQFSQELQLVGNHDRLSWLVGLFYFKEDDRGQLAIPFDNRIVGFPAPGDFVRGYYGSGFIKTEAIAAFGQASYEVLDDLTLTLGARYSSEEKTNRDESIFDVFTPFDFDSSISASLETPPGAAVIDRDRRFRSFTPRIALDYQATPDVLIYASWSKGFKAGTYSLGSFTPAVEPEEVSALEGGIKSSLFDRRVRLNLAGFYYDYTDLQVGKVVNQLTVLENAANATIYGLEAEMQAEVAEGLEVDANVSWLHARFDDYVSADPSRPFGDGTTVDDQGQPAFDLAGNRLGQSPDFTFFVGAQYTLPTNAGDFTLRGEVSYRDRVYFTPFNVDYVSQAPFAKANAFLNWESQSGSWNASVFVKNITDKTTISSAYISSVIFGFPINGYLEEPRTYGVRIGYNF